MSVRNRFFVLLAALTVASSAFAQQGRPAERGVINFLSPPIADPVISHDREIYVLYGCAYCHGVDLKVRNGEAADLLSSQLVGADENGNLIGKILRVGIPQTAKLSPMPQFSDLSDQEIAAITGWIHYSRQQGRFAELMDTKNAPAANAATGKAFAAKSCNSCHAEGALAGLVKKYDAATLKAYVLRPAFLQTTPSFKVDNLNDTAMANARLRHGSLLENYTPAQVADLMAYLQTLK
jgi:mono/diheme cytochrome c family protein